MHWGSNRGHGGHKSHGGHRIRGGHRGHGGQGAQEGMINYANSLLGQVVTNCPELLYISIRIILNSFF